MALQKRRLALLVLLLLTSSARAYNPVREAREDGGMHPLGLLAWLGGALVVAAVVWAGSRVFCRRSDEPLAFGAAFMGAAFFLPWICAAGAILAALAYRLWTREWGFAAILAVPSMPILLVAALLIRDRLKSSS